MTTSVIERQWPLDAVVDFKLANVGTGNGLTVNLPPKTLLKSIAYLVTTAFNAGTTAVGTVSDGTTTFVNGVDNTSVGSKTVANVPKYYPNGGTLTLSGAQTGTAATTGEAIVTIGYSIVGRATEVETN